jgi:DNA invertase Pin-like site-specific DNA recombinase
VSTLCYSYARFSSSKQADGDSLRRQAALRDQWCARNGVTLDESLTMTDAGTSAFRGKHRQSADRTALGAFVDLARRRRVPRGSFLVVESLDRLSREDVIPALSLLLDLIQSGVRVVQLLPVEQVYDTQSNPMQLMLAIAELARGHGESKVKSERAASAWKVKKGRAAVDRRPITGNCPSWLTVVGNKFRVQKKRAKVVREVFTLAAAGYGVIAIVRHLTDNKVPVIAVAQEWTLSYVRQLLCSRSVTGVYQPMRRDGDRRVPDGDPIADFYPRIVSDAEFYAAQAAMRGRDGRRRRGGASTHVNLWGGLLTDARDGTPLYVFRKSRNGKSWAVITRPPAKAKAGEAPIFPAGPFENAVLSKLREIDPRDVLPRGRRGADTVLALTGELAEVEARLEAVTMRIVDGGPTPALETAARRLDERKASLAELLTEAQTKAAVPAAGAWGEFGSLVDVLAGAGDPQDARLRLRGCLRAMVDTVPCLIVRTGAWALCACQVHFHGDGSRSYLIGARPAGKHRKAKWWCRSFAESGVKGSLDLREPKHAATLARELAALTPADVVADA